MCHCLIFFTYFGESKKYRDQIKWIQLWPNLRKPNIIAQYRFFSTKHWNTLGNNCVFWKKSVNFFTHLVLCEGRGQWLEPEYHHIQEELENLCLVAVHFKNCKLWPFVQVTSKRSFVIDVSSWILTLFVVMQGSRRNNLPSNSFLSSWQTWWCKIQVPTSLHS